MNKKINRLINADTWCWKITTYLSKQSEVCCGSQCGEQWMKVFCNLELSIAQRYNIFISKEGNVKVLVFSQNPKENNEYNC